MATTAAERPKHQPGFATVLAQVSAAHAVSHFHIMTLPALIPFLPDRFGLSFIEIGFAITVFSLVSLLVHIPLGLMTDRLGPRPMLIAGLLLGSASFASLSLFQSQAWLLLAMAAAGLANGVYHPAGYALLAAQIEAGKVGRAFSIFTFVGFFGTAITPPILYWTVVKAGLDVAFLTAGGIGAVVAAALLFGPGTNAAVERTPPETNALAGAISPRSVFNPAVGLLTILFLLLSLSSVGIHNFSVSALIAGYQLDIGTANWALTGFLFASAFGVLAGGLLADRFSRHGYVATGALLLTALLTAAMAATSYPAIVICIIMASAGFFFGVIAPSRDMLVRAAAPKNFEGRVFGVVSTGFNAGGVIGPILFGALLDRGQPHLVFALVTLLILIAVALAFVQEFLRRTN